MLLEADAVLRHLDVEVGGQQGDDDVGAADEVAAVVRLRHVQPGRQPPRVAVHLDGGGGGVGIGNGDRPAQLLGFSEGVVDEGRGGTAGADDQDSGGHGNGFGWRKVPAMREQKVRKNGTRLTPRIGGGGTSVGHVSFYFAGSTRSSSIL